MEKNRPGTRWRQLRADALSTPRGRRHYEAGRRQAKNYRETMRVLDGMRRALGISQSELARRMERSQPTIARLLSQGQNPTLASVEEVLRCLGLRGRLIIEVGEPDGDALTVEVQDGQ